MSEMLQKYVGRECLVSTIDAQITGVIDAVEGGWISITTKSGENIVSIDYITRIREYPKKKNGKKKSVVLD